MELEILAQGNWEFGVEEVVVEFDGFELVFVETHFRVFVDVLLELVLDLDLLEHRQSRRKLDIFANGIRHDRVNVTQNEVKAHHADRHRHNHNNTLQGGTSHAYWKEFSP